MPSKGPSPNAESGSNSQSTTPSSSQPPMPHDDSERFQLVGETATAGFKGLMKMHGCHEPQEPHEAPASAPPSRPPAS